MRDDKTLHKLRLLRKKYIFDENESNNNYWEEFKKIAKEHHKRKNDYYMRARQGNINISGLVSVYNKIF